MREYNREILVEVFYDLAKDCERVEPDDKTQMVSYDTRKRGKAAARWAYRRYVQSNTAEVV